MIIFLNAFLDLTLGNLQALSLYGACVFVHACTLYIPLDSNILQKWIVKQNIVINSQFMGIKCIVVFYLKLLKILYMRNWISIFFFPQNKFQMLFLALYFVKAILEIALFFGISLSIDNIFYVFSCQQVIYFQMYMNVTQFCYRYHCGGKQVR